MNLADVDSILVEGLLVMCKFNNNKSGKNQKYGVTGSWTQGLLYAKQALYQLSYNPVM